MRLILLLLISFILLVSTVLAQSDTTFTVTHYYAHGLQAYQAGDFESFKNSFIEANKLRPTNPAIIYNMACGFALTGDDEKAVDLLKILADKGIDFGVDQDSDFNSLKDNKGFGEIINKLKLIRRTINRSTIAFTIPEKDLIPEGIAYDRNNNRIFLSSIYKRKIISVDKNGNFKDFITENQYGLYSTLGMEVDPVRNNLWVCSAALDRMNGYTKSDSGKSAIHKFDLSGKLINVYPSPKDENHEFNDLVINSVGDVYFTDSRTGQIFLIHHIRDSIELLYDEGLFLGSNGITLSSDENILFVAAYSEGIYTVDLEDLSYKLISTPDNCTLYGTDGLYFFNNALIAVQNGLQPNRIVKYVLNDNFDIVNNCEIIEMNNELFAEPTTGVIAGDSFYYIANSQLRSFDPEGHIFTKDRLTDIYILKTEL
ncbi:MAG: hypothetical protein GY865_05690 [candidate division Zixibacteria bacterium]|nr:hypothetical protein [candidate division Zixibacteria bacterium]